MSGERAAIFAALRAAREARRGPPAALPDFPDALVLSVDGTGTTDLEARFVAQLAAANGRAFTDSGALAAWLVERGATTGYVDPGLVAELGPAFDARFILATELDRGRIDDYTFGVTRAAAAIAESGSLVLTDRTTSRRLGALAPWIHVAVVARSRILPTIGAALAEGVDDPYVCWCTGPSKTADVEGILIEGVHGPGEQVALIVD